MIFMGNVEASEEKCLFSITLIDLLVLKNKSAPFICPNRALLRMIRDGYPA
jgi:hypothetical protein